MDNTHEIKVTAELVDEEEVTIEGVGELVIQSQEKETLLQSGRFQAVAITVILDALLASLPVLAHNADPSFVTQLKDAVMLLQVLLSGLAGIFVLARTSRNR